MLSTQQLAPPKPRHFAHSLCRVWLAPESGCHLIRFNAEDVEPTPWSCPLFAVLLGLHERGQLTRKQVAEMFGQALGMVAAEPQGEVRGG